MKIIVNLDIKYSIILIKNKQQMLLINYYVPNQALIIYFDGMCLCWVKDFSVVCNILTLIKGFLHNMTVIKYDTKF